MMMALEIVVILTLVVANGVLAMTELAMISAKKARLRSLAEQGRGDAKEALRLAEDPNEFLSTVQVGITLIGIGTGALGGATLARELVPLLAMVPWLSAYAHPVSLGLVIVVSTFLMLVVGELVPKRVAMSYPETSALFVARPIGWLSKAAAPAVWLLSETTEWTLKLLRVQPPPDTGATEDEIRMAARDADRAGVLKPGEMEMVENVLGFDELDVSDLMTRRNAIVWLEADKPHDEVWREIVNSRHSSFPVCEGSLDRVIGLVSIKAIYANVAAGVPANLRELSMNPLVVPESMPASKLLATMKAEHKHIGLVIDEFGSVAGIVSLIDVLEAIAGTIPSGNQADPSMRRLSDGSYLLDGRLDFEEACAFMGMKFEMETEDFSTVGGFVLRKLGHVPKEGEEFEAGGFRFEVLDMDRHRIDKVRVRGAGGS